MNHLRIESKKLLFVIGQYCAWLGLFTADALAEERLFKGHYIWDAEVHSFKSCGSEMEYWVYSDNESKKAIEFHQRNTTQPYQSVYLEFNGKLLDKATDGFAESYDGLIVMTKLLKLQKSIPSSCD